jgi:uridylate kinase
MLKYKRILFKVSGESLMGGQSFGHDMNALTKTSQEIANIHKLGVQISIVVGGGNIVRGSKISNDVIDRVNADYMGMLATVINGIALQGGIEKCGVKTRMLSAVNIDRICEEYTQRHAIQYLESGYINIFVAGTGNPYFTTDTASILRASEVNCDVVLKGTQVDGVYNKDPKKNPDAVRYDKVSFDEAIQKDLRVMDPTALTLARDNNMPILVFKISNQDAFQQVLSGEGIFSLITNNV